MPHSPRFNLRSRLQHSSMRRAPIRRPAIAPAAKAPPPQEPKCRAPTTPNLPAGRRKRSCGRSKYRVASTELLAGSPRPERSRRGRFCSGGVLSRRYSPKGHVTNVHLRVDITRRMKVPWGETLSRKRKLLEDPVGRRQLNRPEHGEEDPQRRG